MSDDPTLDVARDLREISRLADMLHDQAYHHANDRDFPGGEALAALAPVANLEAWQNKLDTAERLWLDGQGPEPVVDDSDEWEPPLQLLLFWTELWRMDLDAETDHPTLQTETGWILDNLPTLHLLYRDQRWDLFEQDAAKARRQLENTLRDGDRQQSGAPCIHCRRNLIRDTDRKTGGLLDSWTCPGCERQYTEDQYRNAVTAAYASLQVENIDDQGTWATVQRAAVEVKRSPRTVKTWIADGIVRRACLLLGRRDVVSLDDVQREAAARKRRNRIPGELTYSGVHQKIKREEGKAETLACVDCGAPARDWSYSHEAGGAEQKSDRGSPYIDDRAFYDPRCKPCHARLDADVAWRAQLRNLGNRG